MHMKDIIKAYLLVFTIQLCVFRYLSIFKGIFCPQIWGSTDVIVELVNVRKESMITPHASKGVNMVNVKGIMPYI